MPEVRELLDYWEESPPAHEMLQLIATSQFIGWERPNKKKHRPRQGNPPGTRKIRQPKGGDPPQNRGDAEVTRTKGKYAHSIVVDDLSSMYVAAQTMSMLAGGKVSINRKK